MQIYLIRHGETDWNKCGRIQGHEDIKLNDNGIIQANKCGQAFQQLPIDIIVSSPLKRAKETAYIIASYVGIKKLVIENNLIERDYGKLSGLTPDEREKFYNTGQNDEVEDWDNLSQRVIEVINKYRNDDTCNNIVMVSHGAAINSVLAMISEHTIGTGKTKLKNACINVFRCTRKSINIELYNLTVEEFSEIIKVYV